MRASWLENLDRCMAWYAPPATRRLLMALPSDQAEACHTLVPEGAEVVSPVDVPDQSVDVAITCWTPDDCRRVSELQLELSRILVPGGLAFVIIQSNVAKAEAFAGPTDPPPVGEIVAAGDLRLLHAWDDVRGPGRMVMAVLQKGGGMMRRATPPTPRPLDYLQMAPHPDDAAEHTRGARPYLDVLADLHQQLDPRLYLEIGIRHGRSLRLARCPAVAIDPQPEADPLPPTVQLHTCTSDDFFFFHANAAAGRGGFDLAFIDGMHLSDFVLRDFMHVEALMAPGGCIVIDDVLPNHPVQAQRDRQSRVWTGDVWRFGALLAEQRPDLVLTWLDTAPTGLLLVTRLDPHNRVLWDRYNTIRAVWDATPNALPPDDILSRRIASFPDRATLRQALAR